MLEFNDSPPVVPRKKASFKKASLSAKAFDKLERQFTAKEKDDSPKDPLKIASKTKAKDYVNEAVVSLFDKYEAQLADDTPFEAKFGKIVDWGVINVEEMIDKLLIVLEQMCNVKLFPYQKLFAVRVVQSVLLNDGEEITALWSRQSGKSETVTNVVAMLMVMLPILARYFPQLAHFSDGIYVGVFAPTEPQALTIAERFKLRIGNQIAKEFLEDPEVDLVVRDLVMSNGSYVRVHSAAPQSKVESKTYHLIIIDEAQDVSDDKVLRCYRHDTPIFMPDGTTKTIKEVVENEERVLTPNDGIVTPVGFYNNGGQGCFKITLDNGRELSVTSEHIHLCYKKAWRKRGKSAVRKLRTHELLDLVLSKEGVRLAIPEIVPYFGEYGTEKRGRILGYFLGDGCLSNVPWFCGFIDTWNDLNECVFSEFDVKVRMEKEVNGLLSGAYKSGSTWRNPLTQWFRELGVWKHIGEDKVIPNMAFSKRFLQGLVTGLIETDGCIESYNTKPIISFANISEKMVRGLQDVLLKFGVHSRVFSRKQNGELGKNPKDLWILHVKDVESIKRFYDSFKLVTKQNVLELAYNTIKNKIGRNDGKYYPSNMRFQKIVSIELDGVTDTYCVEVPTEDHLIIANGIISGNSIHPMGAATSATIVKLGTPGLRECEFLEAIKRNIRLQELSRGRAHNHFQFDYTVAMRYNERYARFILKEKQRYGEDSDYFRMSYRLEWLLSRGMAVTVEMFEKYIKDIHIKTEAEADPKFMYVAGLDLGKKFDSTVLTVIKLIPRAKEDMPRFYDDESEKELAYVESDRFYKQIACWYEYEGDNWESQIDDIVRVCNSYSTLQTLCIDSTGVGDPIHEIISRRLYYRDVSVIPVHFSLNQQHNLAQIFYKNVNHRNLRVPSHPQTRATKKWIKFKNQLLEAEKVWKNDKMIIRHSVSKGAKDDYVQSLFLSLMAAEECMNIGSVYEGVNIFRGKVGDFDKDAVNLVEEMVDKIDISEVRGFANVRKLARAGKLKNSRAGFRRV